MMTLNLAVRNLLRNRRRSLGTLVAMSIGCASILLFGGFSGNINYEMLTRIVQRGGHLQIQHRDFYLYGSGNPTAYGIADYDKILHAIQKDEVLQKMVVVVTPTLQFGGIAGNYAASVSRTVIGTGFNAADINKMRQWNDFGLRSKAARLSSRRCWCGSCIATLRCPKDRALSETRSWKSSRRCGAAR